MIPHIAYRAPYLQINARIKQHDTMRLGFQHYFKPILIAICSLCAQGFASATCPSLSLQQAMNSAIESSLALKQAEADIQMKLADCWQAGLRINPELSIEVDNLGGSGGNCGFNSSGTSIELSQIFELGNKRTARQNAAAAVATIAIWDLEILKQDLRHKVTSLVINAIARSEKNKLLKMAHENAKASLDCIAEKVKNGKANPILLRQTELTLSASAIAQRKVEAELSSAMGELALFCGCAFSSIDETSFSFFDFNTPHPAESYRYALSKSPEAYKYRSVVFAAGENYQLQKANAVPDIELTAGVCRDNRHRQNTLCLELNVILPVFNQNQGNICRSSWESMSASYQLAEVETKLQKTCANLHDQLMRSFEEVSILKNEALPTATEIVQAYQESTKEGKNECLDLLAAKNRYIELQIELINALTEYHRLKTDLHFLCGN